jgi:hypothetical protein
VNLRLTLGGLAVILCAAAPIAQRATETGVLTGRVLEAGRPDPTPVPRALVTIDAGDGRGERLTATDTSGRFHFDGLATGRYLVRVTKTGWATTYYGSPRTGRPPGVRVAVAADRTTSIEAPLVRGGVIAGRFVDAEGRPMPRLSPWLLEQRLVDDRPMLSRMRNHFGVGIFERSSNDLGEFRLFGLSPGTYYLAVQPNITSEARLTTEADVRWAFQPPGDNLPEPSSTSPVIGYARLYYPGTVDPDSAVAIVVGPGQVRDGLEFRVDYARVGKIEGTVLRPDGSPAAGTRLLLEAREPRVNLEGNYRLATVNAQGRFTIMNVPPDDYRLSASATAGTDPQAPRELWAHTDIVTSGDDMTGLSLALAPAATISGQLRFTGTTLAPPKDLSMVRLTVVGAAAKARSLAGGSAFQSEITATVDEAGAFQLVGLAPDRYLVSATWPGMRGATTGWWLTTIRVGDRVLGDAPLDVAANAAVTDVVIEFSDRIGSIEGSLLDADGRPAPEYFVLAFPVERESWRTTSRRMTPAVRPATDGRFTITGLPGGEYFLAVATEVDSEEAADPRFLETLLQQAIRVRVPEGESVRQDLRIGRQ